MDTKCHINVTILNMCYVYLLVFYKDIDNGPLTLPPNKFPLNIIYNSGHLKEVVHKPNITLS